MCETSSEEGRPSDCPVGDEAVSGKAVPAPKEKATGRGPRGDGTGPWPLKQRRERGREKRTTSSQLSI